MIENAKFFSLPSVKNFKKTKPTIKFRLLPGYTMDVVFKHLGKHLRFNKQTGEGDNKGLYQPAKMYKYDKNMTDEEALERHPLKFTTCCGDQDAETTKEAKDLCHWCKLVMDEGIYTLLRKKFLVGYAVNEDNELLIVNLNKATFAKDIMNIKNKQKYNKWIEVYLGKVAVGAEEKETLRAKLTKEEIPDVDKLNKELFSNYGITLEFLSLENDNYLTKYYDPKSPPSEFESVEDVD